MWTNSFSGRRGGRLDSQYLAGSSHYLGRNDPGFQRYQWDNEFCSCTNPTCKPLSFLTFFRFCPGSAMPVLAVGGEKSFGPTMAAVMRFAATDVEELVVPGSGHWLVEEQP